MKKIFFIIMICMFLTPVYAKEEPIYIKGPLNSKIGEGVVSNDKEKVDLEFNDLGQGAKYEAVIYNDTNKKMYVNDLEVSGLSEKFIEFKLDSKSENIMIEPNNSTKVSFSVNTLLEEGAGRNLDDNISLNFQVSDKIVNPGTFSNLLELIIILLILGGNFYLIRNNNNKKINILIIIGVVSFYSFIHVDAADFVKVSIPGKIKYTSQNKIMTSGTVLNDKEADYTNSKEVWAYYDKVKNIEVKSLIKEPSKYYKKFDLTENKTGRVKAYLIENGDKNTPYDLTIMSNGVVVANSDSSFMFSFPNTESIEGLSNVDFRETTSMQGMFIGNEKITKIEAEAIEMDNTIDTSYMFYNCDEIKLDKDDFELENVTNDDYMILHPIYSEVKKDAVTDKNENFDNKVVNTGKYFMNSTKKDEFPIYYYRGDVENNNVVFGGFCWKIVRTTDTGGTKLIYNGIVKDNGSCDNTNYDEDIKSVIYNNTYQNIMALGYMHSGNIYRTDYSNINVSSWILQSSSINIQNYYFSDKIEYVDGNYKLINAKQISLKDNYNKIAGYYSCWSKTSCSSVNYILGSTSSKYYYIELKNSDLSIDKYFTISNKYEQNGSTYKLKNSQKLKYEDWLFHENDYVGYYICPDFISDNCEKLYRIEPTDSNGVLKSNLVGFTFGNDVVYKDGKYILKDTFILNDFSTDYNKILDKYHYTCGNDSNKCETVRYIVNLDDYDSHYIYYEFNNGGTLTSFIDELHKNYSLDSYIKEYVDLWYENHIIDYTSYIEDTVWCNDKEIKGSLSGVNSFMDQNIVWTRYRFDNNLISVSCKNKNDAFTVSEKNGNSALTYPVGLLTVDEVVMAGINKEYYNGVNSYLNNSEMWWTMSPYNYHGTLFVVSNNNIFEEYSDGGDGYYAIYMRPSISLKHKTKYVTGNGSYNNPYIVDIN